MCIPGEYLNPDWDRTRCVVQLSRIPVRDLQTLSSDWLQSSGRVACDPGHSDVHPIEISTLL